MRFTCTGDVADRFFEGLGAWSRSVGSEIVDDGSVFRFSRKLIKNSYGVDFCVDRAGVRSCVVILAIGAFIDEMDYPVSR